MKKKILADIYPEIGHCTNTLLLAIVEGKIIFIWGLTKIID
jgi:hypothetical protein